MSLSELEVTPTVFLPLTRHTLFSNVVVVGFHGTSWVDIVGWAYAYGSVHLNWIILVPELEQQAVFLH